ncbi:MULTISPECIES: hypothetical protein [Ramlibacter]|uniref:Uncharacterized protein n=1 Tax=Ramlibacter pinisoli TaxID=2682844 RepID=A0A6N8IXL6_9BURK|nr:MULTISPECIES: hypothetical protein [Ramlibacter]MBA2961438.1 hypothetical protein [Ramlibacter sp. CGMCC 1.13660]MVQ31382.1 hypothetical protein [Ramlibacter pinisoli]
MHTALCTFDDHVAAEQARDRLLQAGFARNDVHLERRDSDDPVVGDDDYGEASRASGGVEHEIALDPSVVRRITGFFGHLLGDAHPHRETYSGHVAAGRTVLVVDTRDAADVERARAVLAQAERSENLEVVHRPDQRPLRDVVADTPPHVESQATTQAGLQGRSSDWTNRSERTEDAADRAFASGTPEQRELRTEGDRPNREGRGRTRDDE